jgi:large subunit ribosomal protein L21
MKKAIISTGGKQYLVYEGETLDIDLVDAEKALSFEPLLTIDGEAIKVGTPMLNGVKVTAEIIDAEVKGDKVLAIRYKAKKRVHKIRGHRQRYTRIKITKIA